MVMLQTLWAVVRDGKIELLERTDLPEGGQTLVTIIPEEGVSFWQQASRPSLDRVWDNVEDDIYAELL